MKWEKALKQIETALANNKEVEIKYHRKWAKNIHDYRIGMVENVVEYDWHGDTCKAIDTYYDQVDEGTHIIDEVNIYE